MPAKRQYRVKGTQDFLVLAGIFFFLCLWAIKDAWYPSPKVVKKHPSEIPVAFQVAGTVEKVLVAVDESISENQQLAKLRSDRLAVEFEEAKTAYTDAKNNHSTMVAEGDAGDADDARLASVKEAMDAALARVEELRSTIDATDLMAPSKGRIKELHISPHSLVEAGETAFVIDPMDHFYLFNKSLAVLSFVLFWLFLAIHILAR